MLVLEFLIRMSWAWLPVLVLCVVGAALDL